MASECSFLNNVTDLSFCILHTPGLTLSHEAGMPSLLLFPFMPYLCSMRVAAVYFLPVTVFRKPVTYLFNK